MKNEMIKKDSARETAERIQLQKSNEENARRVLASVCNSRTVLDDEQETEERRLFLGKYRSAVKKNREKFYLSAKEYGFLLRHYRDKEAITLKELSETLHISVSSLEQFESGRTIPEGGNKRRLEKELNFPQDMVLYIVDEAHNYLCGFRNYAPVVMDVCSAGTDNAETTMQGLQALKKISCFMLAAVIMTVLCGALFLVQTSAVVKYLMVGGLVFTAFAGILSILALRVSIQRQIDVKNAFIDVVDSLWLDHD